MSEIKKLFDECFGELASDLPSKVFIRKLQDIILSGRPKKKEFNEIKSDRTALRYHGFNEALYEYDKFIKRILE